MDDDGKRELLRLLAQWRDDDMPLVEAIGDTLARWHRVDSQELARRVVDTVIEVRTRVVAARRSDDPAAGRFYQPVPVLQ